MLSIKINDVTYTCVSSVSPNIGVDYKYNVVTLNGKRHRKVKGTKTSYSIVFFNDLQGGFAELKRILTESDTVTLSVPTTDGEFSGEYYPTIKKYNAKGFLENGTFFEDGLSVDFEKVEYDE